MQRLLAAGRAAGSPAVPHVLSRRIRPAIVTKEKGAGVHGFEPRPDPRRPDKVLSGGVRGRDLLDKLAEDSVLLADPDRTDGTHVWAEVGDLHGYVKGRYLRYGEQIPQSDFWLAPERGGFYSIWDQSARAHLTVSGMKPLIPGERKKAFVRSVGHVISAEARAELGVESKAELVAQMAKNTMMGQPPRQRLWRQAAAEIDKVKARVQRDKGDLVAAGLITDAHELKSVEFTGADFHKRGKAPLFLRFEMAGELGPRPVKLVYKPADLTVDQTLFGREIDLEGAAGPSVAGAMDPGGSAISRYTILTKEEAGEHYSIMEFVQSGGPSNAAELVGVYRSLGANMALSYVVGLEDVHEENVLLLADRVQVIDMEATTGSFKKKTTPSGELDPTDGGFKGQLWVRALSLGDRAIKARLVHRATAGQLTSAPATGDVGDIALDAFEGALRTVAGAGADETFAALTNKLAGADARVVPIATDNFYQLIVTASNYDSIEDWRDAVDKDPGIVARSVGQSGSTEDFVRRVLKLSGTYRALLRGEVPYYTRSLSGDKIVDERGESTSLTGFAKASGRIDEQMQARREELRSHGFGRPVGASAEDAAPAAAVRIFKAQIVPHLTAINEDVRAAIATRGAGTP